jgi:hypothetical protein
VIQICRWGKEIKRGLSQQELCQENGPFLDHSIVGTGGKLNYRREPVLMAPGDGKLESAIF